MRLMPTDAPTSGIPAAPLSPGEKAERDLGTT
jgi:hypothetical protein